MRLAARVAGLKLDSTVLAYRIHIPPVDGSPLYDSIMEDSTTSKKIYVFFAQIVTDRRQHRRVAIEVAAEAQGYRDSSKE